VTAYLWDSGEHRFLFTGDTIYLQDGEWVAAVFSSSERASFIESLELIRELDFDVLVPWAATGGRPHHALTSSDDARRRIDGGAEGSVDIKGLAWATRAVGYGMALEHLLGEAKPDEAALGAALQLIFRGAVGAASADI
jgi:glyoxylase-like metal-dependent hydrolase (beta-lactamase superfamily II)